ncbi:MAG: hypothetical protein ABI651_20375 [Verrucomicrobiota bacterium]
MSHGLGRYAASGACASSVASISVHDDACRYWGIVRYFSTAQGADGQLDAQGVPDSRKN